jgi:hypothetical protein
MSGIPRDKGLCGRVLFFSFFDLLRTLGWPSEFDGKIIITMEVTSFMRMLEIWN